MESAKTEVMPVCSHVSIPDGVNGNAKLAVTPLSTVVFGVWVPHTCGLLRSSQFQFCYNLKLVLDAVVHVKTYLGTTTNHTRCASSIS